MALISTLRFAKIYKKTLLILAFLLTAFAISFLRKLTERPNLVTFRLEQQSILRQTPYTSLAQCERILNGEINCPDIRHKGKTMPRQAQLVLTRMLRIFDLIAKKHGIRYWLYRGTLLGAVRHNGHVPFDTDVDIAIPKLDFEKFVSEGVKELPKDIFFQTEETDLHWKVPSWSGILAKLRDKGSCYKYCIENGCKHNDGLQLDFFVIPQNDREGNFVEIYSHPNLFLRRFYYGSILRKPEEIFPLTQVNFDGFFLPAPWKWKEILTSLYGDFMTLPKNEPPGHIITDPLRSCEGYNLFE
ncbi:uncharacterized protein [Montipora capricornis]|uniref:uncharacterized protein n=1 Tax=Montipora capricornis TaxID=246305 RepID=UPI0035F141EB